LKDIDNIEEWYRDELNNYNVEPDKNLWDSLAEDLDASTPLTDETIGDWYKKEVSKLEEQPDYTVWNKIATQLDTTSVWEKLAVSLNKYDQLIWWKNISLKATSVFLICFGSYLVYDNYFDAENSTAFNSPREDKKESTLGKRGINLLLNSGEDSQREKSYSTVKDSINGIVDGEENYRANSNLMHPSKDNLARNNSIVSNEVAIEDDISQALKGAKSDLMSQKAEVNNEKGSEQSALYASREKMYKSKSIAVDNLDDLKTNANRTIFTEINRRQIITQDISHHFEKGEYLVKKDRDKIVFNSKRFSSYSMFGVYTRRIYAGINIGVKKQGMITVLNEGADLAVYDQSILLDFGSNFGGTVGFILSDNVNIEANLNLNATSGYKRAFDAEGISYQENLNLNYTTINLLAKKMNNKSTFDNKVYSTNLIGGVYLSCLRNAHSEVKGLSRDLNEYKQIDYGIVLGIEQDRYVTKTLVITPGIRYNQGIANVVNSDSQFKSSRNFSFEFNLGVKYIFLKKGK